MNLIEKGKIELLKRKIESKKTQKKEEGRFSLYHAKFCEKMIESYKKYENIKWLEEVIDGWDDYCKLSYEEGMSLDKLIEDPNYVVAIHRTNLDLDRDKKGLTTSDGLQSIMTKGLINFGHANATGGGAYLNTVPEISLTMSPVDGLGGYINLVSNYKNNDTVILAAFPKAKFDENSVLISGLVDKNLNIVNGLTETIYDTTDRFPKIKPEYIIGAILKKNNGLDEFYTREEIINYNKSKKM